MKFLFLVQGEGRGHMTQAISLKAQLEKDGHEIYAGIGTSSLRPVPLFFRQQFDKNLFEYQSPNFFLDADQKGLKIGKSIIQNLFKIGLFLRQIKIIAGQINRIKPHAIINFYEPLGGLYRLLYKSNIPQFGVAHQFTYLHPEFKFPKHRKLEKAAFIFLTKISGIGCLRLFGLSYYPLSPSHRIFCVPPLLRNEIFELMPKKGGFFLVYLLNKGYQADIENWAKKNSEIKFQSFGDHIPDETTISPNKNFTINGLSGEKYLTHLSACAGLITTAGFEAVSEAMYLMKPVFMVPVENHYEQFLNSIDANSTGSAKIGLKFSPEHLKGLTKENPNGNSKFKNWVDNHREDIRKKIYSEIDQLKN